MDLIQIFYTLALSMFAAILHVLWRKSDTAEKLAQNNRTQLEYIAKNVDKANDLSIRLSSLEASFQAEIKNLSISIKRMESALIRIDHNAKCK